MAQKSHGAHHGTRHKHSKDSNQTLTVNDYMKTFEEGETVLVKFNPSEQEGRTHSRFHGRKAEVVGQRGSAYRLKLKDGNKTKTLFIKPIHLETVEE